MTEDSTQKPGAEHAPIRLRCLAGGAATDEILESASRVRKLTPGATRDVGSVLQASMASPVASDFGQRLSRYCLAHEIAEADFGHALRVCRLLLRESSAMNASSQDVSDDARALFGAESEELVAQVVGAYEAVRPAIRRDLIVDALLKHGNILDDIDWRIDVLTTERHAQVLGVPIATVTLAYRNAKESDRITLQMTADQLQRVQATFAALAQKLSRITAS